MDTQGLFEIHPEKMKKSGKRGLGHVKMFGNKKQPKAKRGKRTFLSF
jgi:hypothetical protein